MTPIGQDRIRALVRHAGSMCLLERVLGWDATSMVCETRSHLDPAHPLRRDGVLAGLHLIEYCAQAIALHRGLVAEAAGKTAPPGWLVAIRDFNLQVERLDDLPGPITIKAHELLYYEGGTQYEIVGEADGRSIGGGRISVVRVPQ